MSVQQVGTTAMILAAGRGERMRPLTDNTPKPLLKVAGRALIDHHFTRLYAAGVRRFVINHAWLGEQIEAHVKTWNQPDIEVLTSDEGEALETAGGIVRALPKITQSGQDQRPFWLVNGDVYCDYAFTSPPSLSEQQQGHLVLVNNPPHNISGDFGLKDSLVTMSAVTKSTYSGIALYRPSLFADLPEGKRKLAPLLVSAIESGRLSGELFEGRWHDIGTPERLASLNQELS